MIGDQQYYKDASFGGDTSKNNQKSPSPAAGFGSVLNTIEEKRTSPSHSTISPPPKINFHRNNNNMMSDDSDSLPSSFKSPDINKDL